MGDVVLTVVVALQGSLVGQRRVAQVRVHHLVHHVVMVRQEATGIATGSTPKQHRDWVMNASVHSFITG